MIDNIVMKNRLASWLLILVCLTFSTPCYADVTTFVGANTTPSNRLTRGLALGISFLILGFEFELSDTIADEKVGAPSLRTGMFNVLLQTPSEIAGMQFYGTVGGGLYRERLGSIQETHAGINTGGGIKISLTGPIRIRVDYRLFTLAGNPMHTGSQRIYAGLNVAF